jgi:hypothetical protein
MVLLLQPAFCAALFQQAAVTHAHACSHQHCCLRATAPYLSLLVFVPAFQPIKPLATCIGHQGRVAHVTFLPAAAAAVAAAADSQPSSAALDSSSMSAQQRSGALPLLLTGSDDWTARLWDATSGNCRAVCIGHGGAVTAAAVVAGPSTTTTSSSSSSSSGSHVRLVTGAADGTVGVWGLRGELHGLMQQHYTAVQLLAQEDETVVSGEISKGTGLSAGSPAAMLDGHDIWPLADMQLLEGCIRTDH